jgi:hypothetical protein
MNFWHPAAFYLHHCTINQDTPPMQLHQKINIALSVVDDACLFFTTLRKKVSYIFCCARS